MVLPAWRPNKISSGEHTVNSAVSSTRPIRRGEPVLLGDAHFPWWHFPSLRETGKLQNLLLWASKPGGTRGKVCGELFEEDMHWKTINSCRLSRGQVGDRIPVSHTFGVSLTGVGHHWATFTYTFHLSCTGEGNGSPLQCSCLENPRDGGAWWAAVCGVVQSRTRPKWLRSSSRSVT